ncbi:hypothetical protein B0H13DRAFT_1859349 [Mycena leptocephala]|nr:hypothetical protein B0H13DRAFT_1859349 [Mycena leptocephala]
MPRQSSATELRINNITDCLTPVVTLLQGINDALGPPFVQSIVNTTLAVMTGIKNIKRNKDECLQLVEDIHGILHVIVNLHITSETPSSLPPAILEDIGSFTGTLHKIYAYVEAQQDGNRLKQIFCQGEINTLLKDCRAGLDHAVKIFKVDTGAMMMTNMDEMKKKTEAMHKELLELISALSDGTVSDRSSSPKIFHGRESELEDIMKILRQDSPRIAILGGGGMGKTSLARAVLHHPDTLARFEARFFVGAESATTSIELAALIGLHIGLKPGADLTRPIVNYLAKQQTCLLILDNLETPWEKKESRGGVEEFLSLLTDLEHLALIITMRGAERPQKVRWTRPFLLPLKPLSEEAAQDTFNMITDHCYNSHDTHQLLKLTDNMPLAVDLIAHLVDYEGLSTVLSRWELEKTSILSTGCDRRSSLDASISVSLSSPRITPGSKELLSLLSILPDGLSDVELVQSNLPIADIRACKATLLATSLAYIDTKKRLKSLVPIREHIHSFFPPSPILSQSIRKHFHSLLGLYSEYRYKGAELKPVIAEITMNLANLQQLLAQGLHSDAPDLVDAIYSTSFLNSFYRHTASTGTPLMDVIPHVFPHPRNYRVEVSFIIEVLNNPMANASVTTLLAHGVSYCEYLNDPVLESRFYRSAGGYLFWYQKNHSQAMQFLDRALELSRSCGSTEIQCSTLNNMADLHWRTGNYSSAITLAIESERMARQSGHLYYQAVALQVAGFSSTALGKYQDSFALLHRARRLLSICGLAGTYVDLHILAVQAEVHFRKSEYVEARRIHSEILQDISVDPKGYNYGFSLLNMAQIGVITGEDNDLVRKSLGEARKIFNSLQDPLEITFCDTILADLELREGNTPLAAVLFQKNLKFSWGNVSEDVSLCLERLADGAQWMGVENCTTTWPVVYLANARKSKVKLALHKALLFLGDVFISNMDANTAHSLFTVALEGFTYMDVHCSRAQCMLRLGDLAQNQGDLSKAAKLWTSARPLFERSSQVKDVAQIDARLTAIEEKNGKSISHLMALHVPGKVPAGSEDGDKLGIEEVGDTTGAEGGKKMIPVVGH